eukprot:scaffold53455_cov41-Cyclotella_meneghiniana.AAC.9
MGSGSPNARPFSPLSSPVPTFGCSGTILQRSYLYDGQYSTSEIDQFLASGLFICVTTDTYKNYKTCRPSSPTPTSTFSFLLRQYVYLQDAAHVNVIAPLVQELFSWAPAATDTDPSQSGTNGGGGNGSNGNGGGGETKCSSCQNKECHSKPGIPPDASKCPFKLAHLTRGQPLHSKKIIMSQEL